MVLLFALIMLLWVDWNGKRYGSKLVTSRKLQARARTNTPTGCAERASFETHRRWYAFGVLRQYVLQSLHCRSGSGDGSLELIAAACDIHTSSFLFSHNVFRVP